MSRPARSLLDAALRSARRLGDGRIWFLLSELGSRLPVVWCEQVETACLRRRRGRLEIAFSPGFAADWLDDDDAALFVLLHELLHHIDADLDRLPPDTGPHLARMHNVAADIRINRTLLELPWPDEPPLLGRFYDRDDWLMRFLLPPSLALARAEVPPTPLLRAFRTEPSSEGLAALREPLFAWARSEFASRWPDLSPRDAGLWTQAWLGTDSRRLAEELATLVPDESASSLLILLGSGIPDPDAAPLDLPADLAAKLRTLGQALGAGPGAGRRDLELEPDPELQTRLARRLQARLRRAVVADVQGRLPSLHLRAERRPVPGMPDRRMLGWLRAGQAPPFWRQLLPRWLPDAQRLHVYLDVSGSFHLQLPQVIAVLRELEPWLGPHLWQFSTEVSPLSPADLRAGRFASTCGTSLAAVITHAAERRFRRILVISDGRFETPNATWPAPNWRGELYLLLDELRTPPEPELPYGLNDNLRGVWGLEATV